MRTKILLLTLTLCIIACSGGGGGDGASLSTNACGALGLGVRIVNGTECASAGSSPVARIALTLGLGRQGYCTGSFITRRKVITAAHCFLESPRRVEVLVGDSLESARSYVAASYAVHPLFATGVNTLLRDVAVVTLREDVNVPLLPILVRESVRAGDIVSIFGYGTDENGSFDFQDLESGEMRVSQVTTSNIRADYDGSGSNTCVGDSGGPLTYTTAGRAALAGLTSTGQNVDCTPGDQSYFTNLQDSAVLDFLRDVAADAEYF